MDDTEILGRIKQLVDEEQRLRAREEESGPLPADDRRRLAALQVGLDQCWDYLRQRRAAREYGLSEDQPAIRQPGVVERYQQ